MLIYTRRLNLPAMEKRLFIVSNRLPLTIDEEKGMQQASGGLITAIKSYLNKMSADSFDDVCLISGRSSAWLEQHFGHLPLNLVSEHGARYKLKSNEWITEVQTNNGWKELVHTIMEMYVRRCANTLIEEKDFSMVWHYRNASVGQGALRAFELARELNENMRGRHVQLLMGNKIVEIIIYHLLFLLCKQLCKQEGGRPGVSLPC